MDFRYSTDSSMTVVTPLTKVAKRWCKEHLPDDCPMWGRDGYAIENNYAGPVLDGIIADGLEIGGLRA